MKIIPKRGDYLKTSLITEQEYLQAGDKLISAGFGAGEFPHHSDYKKWKLFGISRTGTIRHWDTPNNFGENPRELSIKDLLGSDDQYVPKVNEPCEYLDLRFDDSKWLKITPLCVTNNGLYYEDEITNEPYTRLMFRCKFRPIKSDRQKFIDEHTQELKVLAQIGGTYEDVAGRLYDNGWRKP